MYDLIL